MSVPVAEADGLLTATAGGVEDTVATITAPRVLTFVVDLNAMVGGDTVTLRVKRKTRSGDTVRTVYSQTFSGAQTLEPIAISVPMPSPHQAVFTITQESGVGKAFPWSVEST